MGHTEDFLSQFQMKRICFLLLWFMLPMLGACSGPVHPRYLPYPEGRSLARPVQGYQGYKDIQIDERAYFILYENYGGPLHGGLLNHCADRWLKGAREYVLYRAGELAKSKGAKYFLILHKDDWNLASAYSSRDSRGRVSSAEGLLHAGEPGAGLVVRLLSEHPPSVRDSNDQIYNVEELLQNLSEINVGLAEYQHKTSQGESMPQFVDTVSRWRSTVINCHPVSVQSREDNQFRSSAHSQFEPGHTITKGPHGDFQVAIWAHRYWHTTSAVEFLWQCVQLAEQQGFKIFKLEDWRVEEHLSREIKTWGAWFGMKATIIPQRQIDPNSLEPVFAVDETRSYLFP